MTQSRDAFIEDLVPFYREACSTENGFLFLETFVKIYLKKFAFLSGEETDYQQEFFQLKIDQLGLGKKAAQATDIGWLGRLDAEYRALGEEVLLDMDIIKSQAANNAVEHAKLMDAEKHYSEWQYQQSSRYDDCGCAKIFGKDMDGEIRHKGLDCPYAKD